MVRAAVSLRLEAAAPVSDLKPGLSETLSRGFCYGNANRTGHLSQNGWGSKGLDRKTQLAEGAALGPG